MMRVKYKPLRSKNGSTMVGVLAAMVFIGVVTTFMVSMTKSGGASRAAYSSLTLANITSENALRAAESFLGGSTAQEVANLLTDVINNGPQPIFVNQGLGTDQQFTTTIVDFNFYENIVVVAGNGSGRTGAQRQTLAFYQLDNLQPQSPSEIGTTLLLNAPGTNFNAPFDITGDVFFGNVANFNQPGSRINGTFKWITDQEDNATGTIDGMTFTQNVYIDAPGVRFQNNSSEFISSVAFVQEISSVLQPITIGDNFFLNEGVQQYQLNSSITCDNDVYLGHNYSHSNINGTIVETYPGDIPDLADRVGLDDSPPVEPFIELNETFEGRMIDIRDIDEIPNVTGITGPNLNEAFESNISDTYRGFLLIHIPSGVTRNFASAIDNIFTERVVFIVDGTLNNAFNLYESGEESNTLFYVRDGGTISDLGSNTDFRGMTYVEAGGDIQYKFTTGSTIYGAVHHVDADSDFNFNNDGNNGNLAIEHNEDVLAELTFLDIFRMPGEDPPETIIIPGDPNQQITVTRITSYQH
ncbi:hypothetical protein QA601_10790 [Chitinispirillales bacterium ANBcel5]|uniref:hypothetical protein n=1 Tax=Cellulosispirillum alkaliphilum TaxID=3039283 RepID=UPI002A505966|nr:hypothetical protein [Chitinispirillales bacterium ANBcel5]